MSFSVRKKIRIAAAAILPVFLILACGKDAASGSAAPNFTLQDLSGQTVSLEQYRGQVVLVDFWATWCPPCRMSIPELVKLQEKYQDKGLVVLGISLDDPQQYSNQYLESFKEKNRINYRILRADERVVQEYFQSERPAIPTMFVVDREGKVKNKVVGFNPDEVKKAVEKLVK